MSAQQITREAMALPLTERVSLAQALWESIDGALANPTPVDNSPADSIRHGLHLSGSWPAGQSFENTMHAARRVIQWDHERQNEHLYQELKAGAEAPRGDFVDFDIEAIIRQARESRANG